MLVPKINLETMLLQLNDLNDDDLTRGLMMCMTRAHNAGDALGYEVIRVTLEEAAREDEAALAVKRVLGAMMVIGKDITVSKFTYLMDPDGKHIRHYLDDTPQ